METRSLDQLLAAKQRRRDYLARLPIEQKIRALVQLQRMAAPIVRQRGREVIVWRVDNSASP